MQSCEDQVVMEDQADVIAKLQEQVKALQVEVTKSIPKKYRRRIGKQESSPGKFSPVIRFSASWLPSLGYQVDGYFQYEICDDHIRITAVDGPFTKEEKAAAEGSDDGYRQTLLLPEEDQ